LGRWRAIRSLALEAISTDDPEGAALIRERDA
jgi:hypothetical protein